MYKLAEGLEESGWSVHTLTPRPPNRREREHSSSGINHHFFDYDEPQSAVGRLAGAVRGASTFKSVASQHDFEIILDDVSHIPFYPCHIYCPEDTVNAVFLHTAFFNAAHTFNGTVKGSVTNAIDRSLRYLNDPEVICAGPSTQNRFEAISGYTRTHVIRPCVNISDVKFNFDADSRSILYLGRLTKRKNVSCLLQAWNRIERKHPEFQLNIAGDGFRREPLKEMSADLGLENVEFLGYVTEEEKTDLLSNSLAMVIPSLMEGYVTTGLEAMASGTPVIGADVEGINDYIRDGENGYLFEKDNPQQLSNLIDEVIKKPSQLDPIAHRARATAEEHTFEEFKNYSASTLHDIVQDGHTQ
jgi:glycosyltransferase involved in cell wall biosynthesis